MSLSKLRWSSVFIIKGHSIESKALRKSSDVSMPGRFCRLVYSIMSLISRIFSLTYLPFTKPVWSKWIRFGSVGSMCLAIAFDVILSSTLSSVIGLQFERSRSDPSSFATKVIIPLRCEMESSPFSWASLKPAIKSFPKDKKKIGIKFNGKSVFPRCFIILKGF